MPDLHILSTSFKTVRGGIAPVVLVSVLFTSLVATLWAPRVAQWKSYHNFADDRKVLGIPRFTDVITNVPFLLVAAAGLRELAIPRADNFRTHSEKYMYKIFFYIIGALAFGSGYYHLNPSNETLVWDRLCMACAFCAILSIIVAERISIQLGRQMLWPAIVAGAAGAWKWRLTEQAGKGDLRWYAFVQYVPSVLYPLILALYPATYTHTFYQWGALAMLILCKVVEFFDRPIYWLSLKTISGHSLHHLIIAAGVYMLVLHIRQRTTIPIAQGLR